LTPESGQELNPQRRFALAECDEPPATVQEEKVATEAPEVMVPQEGMPGQLFIIVPNQHVSTERICLVH